MSKHAKLPKLIQASTVRATCRDGGIIRKQQRSFDKLRMTGGEKTDYTSRRLRDTARWIVEAR